MTGGYRCSFSPGDPQACCCNCCCLSSGSGKSGEGAPGTLWRVPLSGPEGAGWGVRGARRPDLDAERRRRCCCPRRLASLLRAGAEAEERRDGGGVGGVPLLFFMSPCPFASNSVPMVTGYGEKDTCALGALERGSRARNQGVDRTKTRSRHGASARALNGMGARAFPI